MNSKKNIVKRGFGLSLAVAVMLLYSLSPAFMPMMENDTFVYAANNGGVAIETIGSPGGMQGDDNVSVGFEIENNRGEAVTVSNMKLDIQGSDITVSENAGSLIIPAGGKQTISFSAEISKHASTGERTCKFDAKLKDQGGADLENQKTLEENTYFTVYERMATEGTDSKTVAAVDISHAIEPASGFIQGNNNKLKIEFYNYGNTTIKNAVVSLTLPEGLSIYNGSNQADLGYVSIGKKKTVEFPITVKEGIESKNYAIDVQILGLNFMNGDVVAKKTFYIPVEGDGSVSTDNISITNVNIPEEMKSGEEFQLNFTVNNAASTEMKNLKVKIEPEDGVINKSKNIFIDTIPKAGSKQYSVKLYTFDGASEKTYPIKITAIPGNSSEENAPSVVQYATVSIVSDGTSVKKPQLMVDNYTYGGNAAEAGSEFILDLGILNTSGKTLSNIKVSLSDTDGVFVPVGGSNSFFIENIKAKAHYTKSIRLSVKPQAEQKTTAMTVNFTYETGAGEALEASDTIAIPVTQKTRLVVDELVPPAEVYSGEPGTCEIEFYNMGKTTLNNLRVNCEGDFDVMESNSYYAGNMESGRSDSYRFSYIPREVGTMEGTISFTYEDGNGDAQVQEVPFSFEVMDAPVWEDEYMEEEQPKKQIPWALIIAGAVVALGIVGGVIFKKRRKKKLHDALEIEDDFDIDIEENQNIDNTEDKKPEGK